MSKKKMVPLVVLKERLQDIEHYDNPESAFETLLFAFGKKMKLTFAWKDAVLRKGTMTLEKALLFAEYCGYPAIASGF